MTPGLASTGFLGRPLEASARPRLWGPFLVGAAFLASGLWWIALVPFDQAPDEWTHFHYNVQFILEQGRLPVSGVDDIMAYATTQLNPNGLITGRYSYTYLPQLNYLVAAAAAQAGEAVGLEPWRGARLASLAWGAAFLAALYLACRRIGAGRTVASAVTATVALLPQVVFIFSYVNRDAHSLAASAAVAWATLVWWQERRRRDVFVLGACVGLLLTAQPYYFAYLALLAGVGVAAVRSPLLGPRRTALAAGGTAAVALVVSGGWYLRNLWLYGDPLGLVFATRTMASYAIPGEPRSLSLESLAWLVDQGYFSRTFTSFVGCFGYLNVRLPDGLYIGLALVFGFLGVVLVAEVLRSGCRPLRRALAGAGVLLAVLLTAQIWNSLTLHYQPQGRYLFPVLVPAALVLARATHDLPRLRPLLALGMVAALVALGQAHITMNDAYSGAAEPQAAASGVGAISPPLDAGAELTQSFESPRAGLRGIRLYSAVRSIDHPVRAELRTLDGEVLRTVFIAPEGSLTGPAPRSLPFLPLEESQQRRLVLALTSTDPAPQAPIRFRLSAGGSDVDGEAAIDGRPLADDLLFELLY